MVENGKGGIIMAYVIGSQKGKDQAKKMKAGEKWVNTTDGSTWEKKSDGSVSVTHNGQTYNNAYKPSVASSVSRGGSSGGNSQYSYTIGSDYGKQQAQNMGIGTQWVASDGSLWTKENDGTITVDYNGQTYKNAYKPTDLGILGGQQVDAGLPHQVVEQTLYDRLDKIANNPELSQFTNDGTYWKMYNYIQDQKKQEEYEKNLEEFNQDRPEDYQSKYDPRIDALLNEILNRDDFSYDAMNDPLYQQYAAMYQRNGDRAMKETMAEAAAGAGGMNTYAITAAQQANSYYNSQLNDKIPQLYQLAYEMYLQDKESKVQDLGLLQNMDATQYARYRDTMNDFKDDRNFALGLYNDAVAQGNWNKTFDFNSMVDNRNFGYEDFWNNKNFNYNDEWKNKEWNYNDEWKNKEYTDNRSDIEYERNQAEEEEAQATIDWLIKNGVTTIDPAIIQKAGLDEATVKQMITYYQQQNAPKVTTQPTKDDIDVDDDEPKDDKWRESLPEGTGDGEVTDVGQTQKGLTDLGLGLVYDPSVIVELADAGAIYEQDGKLVWSQGWDAKNFQKKLRSRPFPNLISPLNWSTTN